MKTAISLPDDTRRHSAPGAIADWLMAQVDAGLMRALALARP